MEKNIKSWLFFGGGGHSVATITVLFYSAANIERCSKCAWYFFAIWCRDIHNNHNFSPRVRQLDIASIPKCTLALTDNAQCPNNSMRPGRMHSTTNISTNSAGIRSCRVSKDGCPTSNAIAVAEHEHNNCSHSRGVFVIHKLLILLNRKCQCINSHITIASGRNRATLMFYSSRQWYSSSFTT